MSANIKESFTSQQKDKKNYSAPALEKGLDILEVLCQTDEPLTQREIASKLGRSVSEIYRMLYCLTGRDYVAQVNETYLLTPKLFELAHKNSPTQRLLHEAGPIMQMLSNKLDQSCHLTVYGRGKQVVISKVDAPSGMGFGVRVGTELDLIASASGRVLVTFQDEEIISMRLKEAAARKPSDVYESISSKLDMIKNQGFDSSPSVQIKGLHAISFPILDSQSHAVAALTVPFAERMDDSSRTSIIEAEKELGSAAKLLSSKIGG